MIGENGSQPRMSAQLVVVELIERRSLGGGPDPLCPLAAGKGPKIGAARRQVKARRPRRQLRWPDRPSARSSTGSGDQLTRVAEPVRPARYPSATSSPLPPNLAKIVEAGGGGLRDVVQVTVLLANPADFAGMNEEYAKVFVTEAPTRAVTKLGVELPNVLVSIMMTAQVEE
jgi:hypothetical protein